MPALALPAGVALAAFALTALPVVLLMTIWACVTMARILFPERPLPLDGPSRRARALRRGESRPVGLRDILDDEARRRHLTPRDDDDPTAVHAATRLADDLWLRRN